MALSRLVIVLRMPASEVRLLSSVPTPDLVINVLTSEYPTFLV